MPEIWLNYGSTDVVLDIKAENLEQKIDADGETLPDTKIKSKLESLDISKPTEFVILNTSESVRKTLSIILEKYEEKSIPKPSILADKKTVNEVKNHFPGYDSISEFSNMEESSSKLVFVGEMEFDGLFGYETIATRLLKKFGGELMLSAYEKRKGNLPSPGQDVENFQIANNFVDKFDILGIEIVANSKGINDLSVGHPSSISSISKSFRVDATKDVGKHKVMIVSTGKESSNNTLSKSLSSLWNCSDAIRNDGLGILVAECKFGIGSESIQSVIDGGTDLEHLKKSSQYIDGMENLLYISEMQKKFQFGLLSILPTHYSKKLNMISFNGIKQVMEYILKNHGQKQKVELITDGARTLLRQNT